MQSLVVLLGIGFVAICMQTVASQPGRGGGRGPFGGEGFGGIGSGHGGRPERPHFGLPGFGSGSGPGFGPGPKFHRFTARPPIRPAYLGVFQSNPDDESQTNMYQIYSDAYSSPALVNDIINLNISRNGTTYQLVEQVIGGANTTIQSITFTLGNASEATLLGGRLSEVVVRQVGFSQLSFAYNSTAAGGGLTTMTLTINGGPFNSGLHVAYRAGNDTGSREFRRLRQFSG